MSEKDRVRERERERVREREIPFFDFTQVVRDASTWRRALPTVKLRY